MIPIPVVTVQLGHTQGEQVLTQAASFWILNPIGRFVRPFRQGNPVASHGGTLGRAAIRRYIRRISLRPGVQHAPAAIRKVAR